MNGPRRHRTRLSTRLALLLVALEGVVLAGFAWVVYAGCREQMTRAFDDSLEMNAETLATLIEHEGDENRLEFEFADEIMSRFQRLEHPDLFAVFVGEGRLLEKSRSLGEVPAFVGEQAGAVAFHEHRIGEAPYRAVVLETRAGESEDERDEAIAVRVFFSRCSSGLHAQLRSLASLLWVLSLACLGASAGLVLGVVRVGLKPLKGLADQVATINEANLALRLRTDSLPRDLVVMGRSINALMDRVQRAFEKEQQFSADAAHELRTPVAALKSGVQAALLDPAVSEPCREVLEDLLLDVQRLERLCESLLLASSGPAAGPPPSMSAADWADEVEGVVESLRPRAVEAGVELSVRRDAIPASGSAVAADPCTAQRIAANLVENALAHGGDGGRVEVVLSLTGDAARLEVADWGPGIPEGCEDRLFDRFSRAESSRSRRTGGAGLGLAICRKLAVSLGGDVEYRRNEPSGCRFSWVARAARGG